MIREYKYRLNHNTRYWTAVHIIIFALLAAVCFYIYDGGYIMAWYISLIIAVIALMTLSIPRRIIHTDDRIEIECISDHTTILCDEIVSIRAVEPKETRLFVPIFASVGFFGYYGYFLNLRRMDLVKVYASKWSSFVEITDICDDKYYISCDEGDRLIADLTSRTATPQNDKQNGE